MFSSLRLRGYPGISAKMHYARIWWAVGIAQRKHTALHHVYDGLSKMA